MGHPVDIHVGKRLRLRRNIAGLSQEAVAKAVGITFQQIQKYERGVNRMSASRLFEFAQVLQVPIPYFFEGLDPSAALQDSESGEMTYTLAEPSAAFEHEEISKRETLEMMRNYYRIPPQVRKRISDLIRSVADDKPVEETSEAHLAPGTIPLTGA